MTRQATPPEETSVLMRIAAYKRIELLARMQQRPLANWLDGVIPLPLVRNLSSRLYKDQQSGKAVRLILEIKPASPSAGLLRENLQAELPEIMALYQRYASGISVLCDAHYFGGSTALMHQVASHPNSPPVLCKEFILEPYQIYEARLLGASAVLLIVRMLDDERLCALKTLTEQLGMSAVLEIHDEADLQRLLPLLKSDSTVTDNNPDLVLINHRNLDTLALDMAAVLSLAPQLPTATHVIAASGLREAQDFQALLPAAGTFLVGTSLMKEPLERWDELIQSWLNVPNREGAL